MENVLPSAFVLEAFCIGRVYRDPTGAVNRSNLYAHDQYGLYMYTAQYNENDASNNLQKPLKSPNFLQTRGIDRYQQIPDAYPNQTIPKYFGNF